MRDERVHTRSRGALRLLVAAFGAVTVGCSLVGDGSPTERSFEPGSVPVVTPSSAYGPFPYANDGQRRAFHAFVTCAAGHGIDYEGYLTIGYEV